MNDWINRSKVNKERVQLWVDALLSGQYRQGRGVLTGRLPYDDSETVDCCLGVACKVAIANGLELRIDATEMRIKYDGQGMSLPTRVVEWYGFETPNPSLVVGEGIESCIQVNDDLGFDFAHIGEFVRRTYLED